MANDVVTHSYRNGNYREFPRLFWVVPGMTLGVLVGAIICFSFKEYSTPDLSSKYQLESVRLQRNTFEISPTQDASRISSAGDHIDNNDNNGTTHFGRGLGGAIREEDFPSILLAGRDGYRPGTAILTDQLAKLHIHTHMNRLGLGTDLTRDRLGILLNNYWRMCG